MRTASSQFTQNAITAAQATEAERSVVVSAFDEADGQTTTRRTLHNENPCYAVTYYVRRVLEVYSASSRVESIEWRLGDTPWRSVEDKAAELERVLERLGDVLPRPFEEAADARQVTLPTDGTLYEAELAHCSSCDPMREAQLRIATEEARIRNRKACLEAEPPAPPEAAEDSR